MGDISQIAARVRDDVRGNPDEYRDAGAWFDDNYSYAACRHRDAVDREQVRQDCPVGAPIRRAKARRRDYTPTVRLARACRDLRGKYLDRTGALDAGLAMSMDTQDARRIRLLTWLLFDPDANLFKPAPCEFATLRWAFDAVVNRMEYEGRQNIADRLADDRWARLVSVAAAKVMGEAPAADGRWLKIAEGETLTGINRGTIKRAADCGDIVDNGEAGRSRRLRADSVVAWALDRAKDGETSESDDSVEKKMREAEA